MQAPSRPLYKGGSFISSWLRSGNNNNASNANFLTASGNNNNTTVSSVAAVRPALHSLAYKRQGKFSGIQKVQGPLNRKDLRMKGASVLPALIKQWRNLSNLVPTASAETFRRIWFISLHASGWAFFCAKNYKKQQKTAFCPTIRHCSIKKFYVKFKQK